jgi:MHS family alpha-ketoglutarate permease-like MFS transporter
VSVTAGIVLASLIGAGASSLLDAQDLRNWAWRIPFLIGGLLGLVGLYLRRTLQETTPFTAQNGTSPQRRTTRELVRGLARNRVSLARIIGLSLGVTVVYYTWAVGVSGFVISSKGMAPSGALWSSVIANLFFMVSLPFWGRLSDRIGRKPVFITYGVAFMILSFPLLGALNDSPVRLFLIMTVALFLLGAFVGIMPAYFAELFPTEVRASGIGVPYSFIVALFGGTAPYVLTWLTAHGKQWVFALYMVVLVAIGLVTTLLTPETKGAELT